MSEGSFCSTMLFCVAFDGSNGVCNEYILSSVYVTVYPVHFGDIYQYWIRKLNVKPIVMLLNAI